MRPATALAAPTGAAEADRRAQRAPVRWVEGAKLAADRHGADCISAIGDENPPIPGATAASAPLVMSVPGMLETEGRARLYRASGVTDRLR